MLTTEISDAWFARLSKEGMILYAMLTPFFKVNGKRRGEVEDVKKTVCPLVDFFSLDTLPAVLRELTEKTDYKWFQDLEGRWWIQDLAWKRHQLLDWRRVNDSDPDFQGPLLFDPATLGGPPLEVVEPGPPPAQKSTRERTPLTFASAGTPGIPPSGGSRGRGMKERTAPPRALWKPYFDYFYERWKSGKRLEKFSFDGREIKTLASLYDRFDPADVLACVDIWWETDNDWTKETGHSIKGFDSDFMQLLDTPGRRERSRSHAARTLGRSLTALEDHLKSQGIDLASLCKTTKEIAR